MKRKTETQKLQKYLDDQIQVFSQPEKPSFDHIETKLKKIEEKLLGLKSQSQQQLMSSYAQQTSDKYSMGSTTNYAQQTSQKYSMGSGTNYAQQTSQKYSMGSGTNYAQQTSEKYLMNSSASKREKELLSMKEPVVYKKEVRNAEVWTPAKQLDIVPKTMSAVHLGGLSAKESAKKQKKKSNSTVKKKNLNVQSLTYLFQQKKERFKSTPQKSTGRKVNQAIASDAERQVKILKKEIEQQEKNNADLRRRMNQLKTYETECHKLKQIFDRCEQLRRHTRLHRQKF